jgi:opacity protein-like surface antigen
MAGANVVLAPHCHKAVRMVGPMVRSLPLATLLLALLLPAVSGAQQASETPLKTVDAIRNLGQARSFAMGGAYRALGLGAEAVLGNPASLGLWRTYRIEATGAYDTAVKDGLASVSVMDAASSAIAAGFSYHYLSLRPDAGRFAGHHTVLGLALPLSPNFFIGGSGRYLALSGINASNAANADFGMLVRVGQGFMAGVSAHNVFGSSSPFLQRYYSAHAGYVAGLFTVATDVRADFDEDTSTRWNYGAGLEYILGEAIPVRVGYAYDTATRDSELGVGAGIMTEGGGLDLAYKHDFSDRGSRLLALTFKIQLQ